MTTPVVAIVGLSNSGKTTVAVALIKILTERGYSIAAVKHSPHGHQIDRPATDSARLFAAGAGRVIVSSPGQMTSLQQTISDTPLEEIVASLEPNYDLLIAEGFKRSTVPKVMVLKSEPITPLPQNVIAVVGIGEVKGDLPRYTFDQLGLLADQIQGQLLDQGGERPSISLTVDGIFIPLAAFPSNALAGVVWGFLQSLKDVPAAPETILISIRPPQTTPLGAVSPQNNIQD